MLDSDQLLIFNSLWKPIINFNEKKKEQIKIKDLFRKLNSIDAEMADNNKIFRANLE